MIDQRTKPQLDHKAYPRTLRKKSDTTLRSIIKDCQAALKAMPDTPKAGWYQDEIHYCGMELKRRNR